jgi:catechol 2,3-dioxygenase-like lactoylglutathione lyase family enzyme
MRPHISLDVRDIAKSVAFYEKVFGMKPQKQVADYAKFDVKTPALNFSIVSTTHDVSDVNHLGIEVDTMEEIAAWKVRLQHEGILERIEDNIACCFARQDKLWFTDPDGNAWEIFTVHEQLEVTGQLSQTGCCVPKRAGAHEPATCGA